ncbi:YozQ family protein [Virgibacillus sp. YIM 98842]|uniref:YozQ family protein n=1 Tax=Virgibacillus sp. YIM 98842 TaxID=2663533 RepID=UPI0013DC7F83|nr:YozQ family protein [Virgibacillus sp. YIM 98842]
MQKREHADHQGKAKEIADKTYHPENQDNGEELTIIHEQVGNTYKDGTIDIKKK